MAGGTEGRTGRTAGESTDASLDTIAQQQNQFRRELQGIENKLAKQTPRRLDKPTPHSPFITGEERVGDGVLDTVAIDLPPASDIGKLVMTYRETSQSAARNKEISWEDITSKEAAEQHVERQIKEPLKNNTQFGLVALLVKGDFISTSKSRNPDPPDDVNFLTTWTTGQFFSNDPSKPDLGLILENNFDLVTKAFDAFVVVRIYAPINGNYTSYTGTATINGTVTVTGTQSFVGQVAIGMLISISNQTRKVTNVVASTLTVDVAFRGSGSGLELLWGNPHTWATALVERVTPRFRLTADTSAYAIKPAHDISDDEQAQNHIDIRIPGFVAARKYDWVQNLLIGKSGRRHVFPAGTQTFTAGGFANDTPGLPELTGVAYQYDTTEPYDDTMRDVSVIATQPNPPIALDTAELRRFRVGTGTVQISAGVMIGSGTTFTTDLTVGSLVIVGGSQRVTVTGVTDNTHANVSGSTNTGAGQEYAVSRKVIEEKNLRRHKFHPETGGQILIAWGEIALKKLKKFIFETLITSQGGNSRSVDDTFTAGATGPVDGDTAVPGTPAAPSLQAFIDGNVKVEVELPSTNIATFIKFQVVMSTQATAPAGDPTVGLEGVQKIRKGHTGFFEFQRPLTDISSTTYYFYARCLNSINWSLWSAGTSILGSTISRPIEDSIGSGVPILPIRLEASGTAPASPPVANDTTHFTIDTADTVDYQTLITAGIVLHLHIPSLAAANRVRKATAYSLANHRFTVDVAFSATPGNR